MITTIFLVCYLVSLIVILCQIYTLHNDNRAEVPTTYYGWLAIFAISGAGSIWNPPPDIGLIGMGLFIFGYFGNMAASAFFMYNHARLVEITKELDKLDGYPQ